MNKTAIILILTLFLSLSLIGYGVISVIDNANIANNTSNATNVNDADKTAGSMNNTSSTPNNAEYSIIGTWVLTDAEADGIALGAEIVSALAEMSFDFKPDGVVTIHIDGAIYDASYIVSGNDIDIVYYDEIVITFTQDNGRLIVYEDDTALIFTR